MVKTRIIYQKWLVNELVLFFLDPLRGFLNFNPIILSKVIICADDNDDDRQTDTVVKSIFSYSGRLKTLRFYENLKSHFLHIKPINIYFFSLELKEKRRIFMIFCIINKKI